MKKTLNRANVRIPVATGRAPPAFIVTGLLLLSTQLSLKYITGDIKPTQNVSSSCTTVALKINTYNCSVIVKLVSEVPNRIYSSPTSSGIGNLALSNWSDAVELRYCGGVNGSLHIFFNVLSHRDDSSVWDNIDIIYHTDVWVTHLVWHTYCCNCCHADGILTYNRYYISMVAISYWYHINSSVLHQHCCYIIRMAY